jgi:hypothetical protein
MPKRSISRSREIERDREFEDFIRPKKKSSTLQRFDKSLERKLKGESTDFSKKLGSRLDSQLKRRKVNRPLIRISGGVVYKETPTAQKKRMQTGQEIDAMMEEKYPKKSFPDNQPSRRKNVRRAEDRKK